MILTFLPDARERSQCDRRGRYARDAVRHCATHAELQSHAAHPGVHTIVANLVGWSRAHVSSFLGAVGARATAARILAVHGLSSGEVDVLRALSRLGGDVISVYHRFHDLEALLSDVVALELPSGSVTVIRELPGDLAPALGHFLVSCIVLGERHTTLRQVATEAGISASRARQLTSALGYGDFRHLASDVRLLHTLYRIGRLGASERGAAIAAGFSEARELDRLCRRRAGVSPVHFARHAAGFERCLAAFVTRVVSAGATNV